MVYRHRVGVSERNISPKIQVWFLSNKNFLCTNEVICMLVAGCKKKELTILLLRCSLDAGSDEVGSETHSALKIENYCKNK